MTDTANEYDNLDDAILLTIPRVREEHHACTARSVASRLGASPDVVKYRCQKLKDDGLITWTDMAGSLRLVEVEAVVLEEPVPGADQSAGPLASDVSPDAAAAQASPPAPSKAAPAPKPKPARKRPAKKAAAKKPARKRAAPSRPAKPAPQSA